MVTYISPQAFIGAELNRTITFTPIRCCLCGALTTDADLLDHRSGPGGCIARQLGGTLIPNRSALEAITDGIFPCLPL